MTQMEKSAKITVQPVSANQHKNKFWKHPSSYHFAQKDSLYPLLAMEMTKAVLGMPTAFILRDNGYALVAIQGIEPGNNLLVGADGNWRSNYIPLGYRNLPFILASTQDAKQLLCVHAGSDLVFNSPSGSNEDDQGICLPFYTAGGELHPKVTAILDTLKKQKANHVATSAISALLAQYDLLIPWQLNLAIASDYAVEVKGLYRVKEESLNALAAEDLKTLQSKGALSLAYLQLLSIQHIQGLCLLAQRNLQATVADNKLEEINFDSFDIGGSISFENL